MRLVLTIHSTDGCTWNATDTTPVEYESAEKFLCDFEDWKVENPEDYRGIIYSGGGFAGTDLDGSVKDDDWKIMTIDEWFKANGI